jgi:PAS domain S-box-containing protein
MRSNRWEKTGPNAAPGLILGFAFLALVVAAGGYLYYSRYETNLRAEIGNQLSAIGQLKADQLASWRAERLSDASSFSLNVAFAALVKNYLDAPSDRETDKELLSWLTVYRKAYGDYDEIRLLDVHGATRLSVPSTTSPVAPAVAQSLPGALQSGGIEFVDFYRSDSDQAIRLTLLVPIRDNQDERTVLGIVALRIDPAVFLYPLISRWPTPSATAETLLLRRDGNDALFLNELKFQKNTALSLRIPVASPDVPAVKAVLGETGIVEGLDYRGVRVIADVRPVPDTPWSLVARMDDAEVYAPLRERLWQTVALIGVALLGTGAGLGFLSRHREAELYRERAEASEARRASEVRYRRLFESAKDGILILDAETGMVVDVNPFLIELVGCARETVLEKRVWELGFLKDTIANQANFAELQHSEYVRYEDMPLETADGRRIEVEFISNVYLVNHQKVIQCSIRDISERKRAEEALRVLSARHEAILDSVPDIIMEVDANKTYTWMNRPGRAFFGEDAMGKQASDYFVGQQNTYSAVQPLFDGGESLIYVESWQRRKDGEERLLAWWCRQLRDQGGRVTGVLSSARDITELQRAEAEKDRIAADLKRSNKELEQFAYVASHDLQEPLRMVSSYVQLLAQRYEGQLDDKAHKYIHYAVDGALRMQQLIEDLLTYSRAGTRGGPLEPTDSRSALDEAVRSLGKMIEESGAVITHAELPLVRANAPQLAQVFQNLLSNAIKFHGEAPPHAHVSAEDKGREWVFSVKDNGIGIDPQYKDRVFVIFQRLHTRQEYPGTGIGLAVCQRIVERHDGRVWFESAPGKGSTFCFSIPK